MFGKRIVNLWLDIPFYKKFEARRFQAGNCSFGAFFYTLHIIVDTGVFLSSSGQTAMVTLQPLVLA